MKLLELLCLSKALSISFLYSGSNGVFGIFCSLCSFGLFSFMNEQQNDNNSEMIKQQEEINYTIINKAKTFIVIFLTIIFISLIYSYILNYFRIKITLWIDYIMGEFYNFYN